MYGQCTILNMVLVMIYQKGAMPSFALGIARKLHELEGASTDYRKSGAMFSISKNPTINSEYKHLSDWCIKLVEKY